MTEIAAKIARQLSLAHPLSVTTSRGRASWARRTLGRPLIGFCTRHLILL
jgi:hypothetical protein